MLRKLNDKVLKECAIEFTRANANLAVFSYVLSKIVSKPRFLRSKVQLRNIELALERLLRKARSGDEKQVLSEFSKLEDSITALEETDQRFLIGLVTKGKLKMAATFYAQGASLGVASQLTGIDKQEILDYAGQTMMFDRLKEEKTITERMKTARAFLSG